MSLSCKPVPGEEKARYVSFSCNLYLGRKRPGRCPYLLLHLIRKKRQSSCLYLYMKWENTRHSCQYLYLCDLSTELGGGRQARSTCT